MNFITDAAVKAVKELYSTDITAADLNLQETRKDFEGQLTIVTFPFTRFSKKSPEQTGIAIGEYLLANVPEVAAFNVIKGFLNISVADSFWLDTLYNDILPATFAQFEPNGQKVMVEYSSPNTNKPLHLGHVRNNLLGFSISQILAAAGYEVVKANLVNDRGIHICKSMLAWQKFGNGETPESTGIKGDHLVGKYYVLFEKEYKKQLNEYLEKINRKDFSEFKESLKTQLRLKLDTIDRFTKNTSRLYNDISNEVINELGFRFEILLESAIDGNITSNILLKRLEFDESISNKEKNQKIKYAKDILEPIIEIEKGIQELEDEVKEIAGKQTPLMIEAQQMLLDWERGDEAVISLWKTMNSWVYAGFADTYKALGVDFDKYYYESNTYLLGKDIIDEGLEKGVFFKKEDGSVWIDLTENGLDEKLVLRSDGTSVYITQDLGTAQLKYNDFHMDRSIYVVGNEQDYHFKVLFLILQKLGKAGAGGLFHLSYGMVDLPSGKMKSREGTVVDADDLMAEMEKTAKDHTEAHGKAEGLEENEKLELYHIIGMGALKYFLLKVDPQKRLLFDPNESVALQGNTGPFIQYTHARIRSVIKKSGVDFSTRAAVTEMSGVERDLIVLINRFPETIQEAATDYSPAIIANYVYELAKLFNTFYHECPILQAETDILTHFRLQVASSAAKVIKKGMGLLGIDVPERM